MKKAVAEPTWWADAVLDQSIWGPVVEEVLQHLVRARDTDRFPHALLLVGPAGLGRELAAAEAACLLSCPGHGELWCTCDSCRRVRAGLHPDVRLVLPKGAAEQIRIAQIREVVEAAAGRPFEAAARVWILDGVEAGRFGGEAANAMLKTLEEPPAHACFVLLAANPDAVLATIRSRCQLMRLPGPVAVAVRRGELEAPELAAASSGRPGLSKLVGEVRAALAAAPREREVLHLVRLARRLQGENDAFAINALAALEEAVADPQHDRAQGLACLAGELLAAERRTRVLNLSRERQLLALLLTWYRRL